MAGLTFVLSGGAASSLATAGKASSRGRSCSCSHWSRRFGWWSRCTSSAISPRISIRRPPWRSRSAGHGPGHGRRLLGRPVRRARSPGPALPGPSSGPRPPGRHDAAAGRSWQAAGFEATITFGLVLMILNLANGPKLNGPFIPLAVGAYIMAWGTMGGPFDGASMNPARSFGPDLAMGNLSTWWSISSDLSSEPWPPSAWPTCCAARPALRKRGPRKERRSTGPPDRGARPGRTPAQVAPSRPGEVPRALGGPFLCLRPPLCLSARACPGRTLWLRANRLLGSY